MRTVETIYDYEDEDLWDLIQYELQTKNPDFAFLQRAEEKRNEKIDYFKMCYPQTYYLQPPLLWIFKLCHAVRRISKWK